MHRVVQRIALAESRKTTALKHARLKMFMDKMQANYELGMDIIGLVCRNLGK